MPRNFSVADVLDDTATFDPAVLAAVRALARAKPWRDDVRIRALKLAGCLESLAAAYDLERLRITFARTNVDRYVPASREIRLDAERLSVVTFLHLFARARGMGTFAACRWSINLFRRCFPRSYANLVPVGPFLITRDRAAQLGVSIEGSN